MLGVIGWLLVSLLISTEARYFGGYYQDDQNGLASQSSQVDNQLLEELLNLENERSEDGTAETVGSNPVETIGNRQQLFNNGGNHAEENIEWTKNIVKSISKLGQISGLASSQDFLYLFHRGNVTWNERSFNEETNVYNHQHEPISVNTVVAVDHLTGEIMFSWGKSQFFMPHGISVDPQGNIWLTDVALHQAFRYKKNNFDQPDLVLGEAFIPGSDDKHFCKPTDVAIASTGVIYISDGYCNSRVVIFSAIGQYLAEIGRSDKMIIPHSLSLLEVEDLLCVADRENGRIMCYNAGLSSYRQAGQLLFDIRHSELIKPYAIAHIGDIILSLNGGSESTVGISMDLATEQVVDLWSPNNDTFHSAHDMAMSHDERSFYVCQFSGNNSKVIKFNLVESSQMLLIN